MKTRFAAAAAPLALAAALLGAAAWQARAEASMTAEAPSVERGRYIARVAGCNDCHTPEYATSGGQVPESEWLVGDSLGWKGPWGTTYPSNLRAVLARIGEDEWVRIAHTTQYRPPMPWFALRDMSETDLRSFYRFVRSLGPGGGAVPSYVPPGQQPVTPVISFPEPPAPAPKTASR